MQLRIWATLERLAARHRNRTIVVVSHADPIKAAVTYALGVPLDLFQRTVISTVLDQRDRPHERRRRSCSA